MQLCAGRMYQTRNQKWIIAKPRLSVLPISGHNNADTSEAAIQLIMCVGNSWRLVDRTANFDIRVHNFLFIDDILYILDHLLFYILSYMIIFNIIDPIIILHLS